MSNPFLNFLSGAPAANGVQRTYKSYAHATGLYTNGNRMAFIPKLGFIYFVSFNLHPAVVDLMAKNGNANWKNDLGFLAKKVDLPKFKVATQTVNQYNRKTNIQTKLTYEPITIDFHDDNSEVTSFLWRMYYQFYYVDGTQDGEIGPSFKGDTKFDTNNEYGYAPTSPTPFFNSIDIFVLHQGSFSQYTITNPLVTSWDHDSLDQSNGTKIMQNKISFAYDSVVYYQGVINQDDQASQMFSASWYDNDTNIKGGNTPPHEVRPPSVIPGYSTPIPPGMSPSQQEKAAAQYNPSYPMPRPIGNGTFGLPSYRPPGFSIGVNVWYGHGGLHGVGVVQAGPIRLVLKK